MAENNSIVSELNTNRSAIIIDSILHRQKKPIEVDFDTEPRQIDAFVSSSRRKLEAEFNGLPNSHDAYSGQYAFIPTRETQTIDIKDKIASQNIIINPIPNNYGLITYNGSKLTVS